mgnify:CR=1 FL=1
MKTKFAYNVNELVEMFPFSKAHLLWRLSPSRCLAMNSHHRVVQISDIPKPFCAEPGRILPTEYFAKGVVLCRDIPVTISIGGVNRASRPVRLPLQDMHPHRRCKN